MTNFPVIDTHVLTSREEAMALFTSLLQRANETGTSLGTPPPEPEDCCGRGCNGCVWEGYFSAVAYWRDEALLQLLP